MSRETGQAPLGSLLVISIVGTEGIAIVQTVWAVTPDLRAGRRVTRTESFAEEPLLRARIGELVPLLLLAKSRVVPVPKTTAAA
jgi:hypothetical protein